MNTDVRIQAPTDASAHLGFKPKKLGKGTLLAALGVFLGYYLGAKIGIAFTFPDSPVSVMWPPNCILVGVLLLNPTRAWWIILLAALPAHLITQVEGGVPPGMMVCWYFTNCAEALIGAGTFRAIAGSAVRFDRMRSISLLFLCGGLIGPFLSSFIDAAAVTLNQFGQQPFWQIWWTRLCSNVFAALTVTPVIVMWGTTRFEALRQMPRARALEIFTYFMVLVGVTFFVFCWQEAGSATIPILLYTPLPFLLWAAVRFGTTATATGILIVAGLAIWGAVHGYGPFTTSTPEQNAVSIQAFFVAISVTVMFLAATIKERSRAEERFTKAFRSGPDAMLISRLNDARVIEINDRWEKMLGYSRKETVGKPLGDLNICTSEANHQLFVQAISMEHFHDLELSLRAKEGHSIYTLVSGDTDDIAGEECWIFVVRDISDRRRAEEAQQNLAHVSRLAVVGELTAMIAHEINQPLGAILSNADAAEILLESPNPPLEQIREIISDIRKNDLRADEAIKRIRALLRKREMQMLPLDLNDTITDVLRLVVGDALRRRVIILKELGKGLPQVHGDRVHLQQVVLNLILNGMDAMNDTPDLKRCLTVKTKMNGEGVEIVVSDCGHGLAPDKTRRVFDSFYTTKKEGMGLGLSIARSIMEAHRGRIWAENNGENGATFHCVLPANGCRPN